MQIYLSVQRDKTDCDIVGGKMTAERVRIILWSKIERKKSNKKETGGKGRKESVKIVVKVCLCRETGNGRGIRQCCT